MTEPIDVYMLPIPDDQTRPRDQIRNLSVDNPVVVPVNTFVRVQVTAEGDAIHAFAMPAFGLKEDAVPGRLNETYFKAEREGVFYGQCSELCGKDHAFMPIEIRVVSADKFRAWAALRGVRPSRRLQDARRGDGRRQEREARRPLRAGGQRWPGADDGYRSSITMRTPPIRPAGSATSTRPTTRTSARCT